MPILTPEQIEAKREEFFNKTPFFDIFCIWMRQEGVDDFWGNAKWYGKRLDKCGKKNK